MSALHGTPDTLEDGPAVRAEYVFGAVAVVMILLLALSGMPATADQVAGNGSDALRKGWLARHQGEALAADAEAGGVVGGAAAAGGDAAGNAADVQAGDLAGDLAGDSVGDLAGDSAGADLH